MITLTNISKTYRIYHSKTDRIMELLTFGKYRNYKIHHALRNINLSIPAGSTFGIMGMNGAGKSTLLKILTGTCIPTSGVIESRGRIASILELGAGFHPDLTGEENVELTGKLMGLTKEEIVQIIPKIIQFSELGNFFNAPVKTYSSGMYVRLAFALATAVEPKILIIDEALSVGDIYFQQKCTEKIREFQRKSVTILLVSHDAAAISQLCHQVALLNEGRVIRTGSPKEILEIYSALLPKNFQIDNQENRNFPNRLSSGNLRAVIKTVTLTRNGKLAEVFCVGDRVRLNIEVYFNESIEDLTIGFVIRNRFGYDIFGINNRALSRCEKVYPAKKSFCFHFEFLLSIGPGEFTISVAAHSGENHIEECYNWVDQALAFKVTPDPNYPFVGVSCVKTNFSETNLENIH